MSEMENHEMHEALTDEQLDEYANAKSFVGISSYIKTDVDGNISYVSKSDAIKSAYAINNNFDQIIFEKDYGVDIGILLDMIHLDARIKEVHIGTIKNVSQQWQSLEKMSREVMKAIIKRANY